MDKFKAKLRELQEERPSAVDIRIRLFGSAPGQSEVSLRVSPTGEFAEVQGEGPVQQHALAALLTAAERELRAGLQLLGHQ